MSNLKTQPNQQSVNEFLEEVSPDWMKEDSFQLLEILREVTNDQPIMWGNSLIGFGSYHYKYKSGREGDWFLAGFSPRKQNMTVYIMGGFENQEDLLEKLGKFKKSSGCLYFKKLEDLDIDILKSMIIRSIETVKQRYADYN